MITVVLFVCGFLLLVAAIEHYASKSRVPAPVWVLAAGVAYGYMGTHVTTLPELHIAPDITFFVFLPVLLFASARSIRLKELAEVGVEAGVFAILGVGGVLGVLTLGMILILQVDPKPALLLATALAGTNPMAIGAVLHKFGFPRRMHVLIEAESMLNDGVTVLLFTIVSAILFQRTAFVVEYPVWGFFAVVAGGAVIGIGAGFVAHAVLCSWRALHDHFIGVLFPLITVYLVFVFAKQVLHHVSGIIAVMAVTLTMGALHERAHTARGAVSKDQDRFFEQFWGFASTLVNAIVFFVLGSTIGAHAWNLDGLVVAALIALLIAARALSVYGCGALLWPTPWRVPLTWQHGLNLAGLKGSLSIALLLQLPSDYEHRLLFLCAAFVLVLFTLIANPLIAQCLLKPVPSR